MWRDDFAGRRAAWPTADCAGVECVSAGAETPAGTAAAAAPGQGPEAPAWEAFPEGRAATWQKISRELGKSRKGSDGKRSRPCGPKAIKTRRAELLATARMAVKIGMPIENLNSLAALVHPDVAEPVLDAYWKNNGVEPKVYTIDLGWKLLSVARQTGLDEASIERLDDFRASLGQDRPYED